MVNRLTEEMSSSWRGKRRHGNSIATALSPETQAIRDQRIECLRQRVEREEAAIRERQAQKA